MNQRRLDLQHGSSNTIAPPAPFDLKNPEDWHKLIRRFKRYRISTELNNLYR